MAHSVATITVQALFDAINIGAFAETSFSLLHLRLVSFPLTFEMFQFHSQNMKIKLFTPISSTVNTCRSMTVVQYTFDYRHNFSLRSLPALNLRFAQLDFYASLKFPLLHALMNMEPKFRYTSANAFIFEN